MSLSLYISNTELQILQSPGNGKRVSQAFTFAIPEGVMMNGVITDEARLSDFLKDIWEQYHLPVKDAELVIDSGKIMTRLLELPRMKSEEVHSVAEMEFRSSEREDQLIDYMATGHRGEDGNYQILAASVERSLVESYLTLWQEAGVQVKSVNIGLPSILSAMRKSGIFRGKTGLLLVMENMMVTSLLFENGVYQYSRRTRLFGAEGSPERRDELAQLLSTLQQFHLGRRSNYTLDSVYYTPLSEDDGKDLEAAGVVLGLSVQELNDLPGIGFPEREAGDASGRAYAGRYLLPLGSLIAEKKKGFSKKESLEKHRMDFCWQYNYDPERAARQRKRRVAAILVAAFLVVLLAVEGVLQWERMQVAEENRTLEEYLSDAGNQAAYARYQELAEELEAVMTREQELRTVLEVLDSYPHANSRVLRTVESCAGEQAEITVEGYDSTTGKLNITAVTSKASAASEVVDRIQELGLFQSVYYTGYDYSEVKNGYLIHVVCLLGSDAGK